MTQQTPVTFYRTKKQMVTVQPDLVDVDFDRLRSQAQLSVISAQESATKLRAVTAASTKPRSRAKSPKGIKIPVPVLLGDCEVCTEKVHSAEILKCEKCEYECCATCQFRYFGREEGKLEELMPVCVQCGIGIEFPLFFALFNSDLSTFRKAKLVKTCSEIIQNKIRQQALIRETAKLSITSELAKIIVDAEIIIRSLEMEVLLIGVAQIQQKLNQLRQLPVVGVGETVEMKKLKKLSLSALEGGTLLDFLKYQAHLWFFKESEESEDRLPIYISVSWLCFCISRFLSFPLIPPISSVIKTKSTRSQLLSFQKIYENVTPDLLCQAITIFIKFLKKLDNNWWFTYKSFAVVRDAVITSWNLPEIWASGDLEEFQLAGLPPEEIILNSENLMNSNLAVRKICVNSGESTDGKMTGSKLCRGFMTRGVNGWKCLMCGEEMCPSCEARLKSGSPDVPICEAKLKSGSPDVPICEAKLKSGSPDVSVCEAKITQPILPTEHIEHICDPQLVQNVKFLTENSKNCPNCSIPIMKSDGCREMFCVKCKQGFDWISGELQLFNTNPEFYQWNRERSNTDIAALKTRVSAKFVGEDSLTRSERLRYFAQYAELYGLNKIKNLIANLETWETQISQWSKMLVSASVFENLRIDYLVFRISEEEWASLITAQEKQFLLAKGKLLIISNFFDEIIDKIKTVLMLAEAGMGNPKIAENEVLNEILENAAKMEIQFRGTELLFGMDEPRDLQIRKIFPLLAQKSLRMV